MIIAMLVISQIYKKVFFSVHIKVPFLNPLLNKTSLSPVIVDSPNALKQSLGTEYLAHFAGLQSNNNVEFF